MPGISKYVNVSNSYIYYYPKIIICLPAFYPWSSSLCHSLVRYTNVVLFPRCMLAIYHTQVTIIVTFCKMPVGE